MKNAIAIIVYLVTFFGLVSTSGYAQSICNSTSECRELLIQTQDKLEELRDERADSGNNAKVSHSISEAREILKQVRAQLKALENQKVHALLVIQNLSPLSSETMTQDEAHKYCEAGGMRLPTARELAYLAIASGAGGISGLKPWEHSMIHSSKKGDNRIKAVEINGAVDSFYFSSLGYEPLKENNLDKTLWSSSAEGDDRPGYYYMFINGDIVPWRSSNGSNHVRCIAK